MSELLCSQLGCVGCMFKLVSGLYCLFRVYSLFVFGGNVLQRDIKYVVLVKL